MASDLELLKSTVDLFQHLVVLVAVLEELDDQKPQEKNQEVENPTLAEAVH